MSTYFIEQTSSVELRREASELLHAQGLLTLVEQWGEVFVGGSYSYDLMGWRDLDIYIKAPTMTIAEFFRLGAAVTTNFAANKSYFTDSRGQSPDGLYWGIRLGDISVGAWKLDIWALVEADYQRHIEYAQRMATLVTPETRNVILQIKQAYWHTAAYRDQVTSHSIYDAVLNRNVKNLEEFNRQFCQIRQ